MKTTGNNQNYNIRMIKSSAALLFAYILLMLSASFILIFSFDFPDILREPVSVMLAKFYRNRELTIPAYYLFVLSGIVFIFMTAALYKSLSLKDSLYPFLSLISGVLFGLLSNLGFIRWPFLMSYLG